MIIEAGLTLLLLRFSGAFLVDIGTGSFHPALSIVGALFLLFVLFFSFEQLHLSNWADAIPGKTHRNTRIGKKRGDGYGLVLSHSPSAGYFSGCRYFCGGGGQSYSYRMQIFSCLERL
jgi:hypothetical protein